jgi:hypothetical protein
MVAPAVNSETLIGRTKQGETVLLVPGTKALLMTPDGVVALIQGLATSQGLTVVIHGATVRAAPNLVPLRVRR